MHTTLLVALLAFGRPAHATLLPRPCGVTVGSPDRPGGGPKAEVICPSPAGDRPPVVNARLYIAVPSNDAEAREAQATAKRILAAAGIPLHWTVCDRTSAILE